MGEEKLFKIITRLFLVFFMAGILSLAVYGVPVNNLPQRVSQENGAQITIRGFGDEFFNWVEDEYGNVIAYNAKSGNWHYATVQDGCIVPSGTVVNPLFMPFSETITRSDLQPLIDNIDRSKFNKIITVSDSLTGINAAISPSSSGLANNNPAMLVLLIEYNDIRLTQGIDYWHNHHFDFGTTGSTVNNYFAEASNGAFAFKPAVFKNAPVGKITAGLPGGVSEIEFAADGAVRVKLNKNHPTYYNGIGMNEDINIAFAAIYQYIDFTSINKFLTNYIKREDFHVSVVTAGWENSTGVNDDKLQRVHAHANTISVGIDGGDMLPISVDMKKGGLVSFNVQGELYSGKIDANSIPMGIGVTVHELGHSLGLPDLYDTSGLSSGIGPFCVMSSGSWGAKAGENSGDTPVHLSAWAKIELGFLAPEVIQSDEYKEVNLANISSDDYSVLKLTSTIARDPLQYFLVENRGLVGYDAGFFGFGISSENNNNGGVIVYHIDESMKIYVGSENANKNRRLVNVLPADNNNLLNKNQPTNGYGGSNFFFSTDTYGTFNADTAPNSDFYAANNIRNILSGIQCTVNSSRGEVMQVEVGKLLTNVCEICGKDPCECLLEDILTDSGLGVVADDGGFIKGEANGITKGQLSGVTIYEEDVNGDLIEINDDERLIGTGMIIKKGDQQIVAVIKGDVTGRGEADIIDAKAFLESLVGNKNLEGAYAQAADDFVADSAIKSLRAFLHFVMAD